MNISKKKLIPTLVFVLTIVSLLRLLKITISTSTSPPATALLNECSSPSAACGMIARPSHGTTTNQRLKSSYPNSLTGKEVRFLTDIISRRAPCNILVFGIERDYLTFPSINAGGNTMFLDDNPEKISIMETITNSTHVYKAEYKTTARQAYSLLKHARKNPGCSPQLREVSWCKLALTELPKEVYELKWDVVVVDGPSGDGPDEPGRMAAIYTASILARTGNMTDVVVHDVDRMIEKWYSWEFLCNENLVSSKGKFWNFRIAGQSNATTFCPR